MPILIGIFFVLLALLGVLVFMLINRKKKDIEQEEEKIIHTTQNQLPFEYIRRGVVKLKSGQYVKIMQVPALNILLMEEAEREFVREIYAGILNSLDFNIQFVKQSRLVDVNEYLQFLKEKEYKAENKFRAVGIREYSLFIAELVKENSLQTKKDFVVIPYVEEKTKDKNKTEDSMKKYRKQEEEQSKSPEVEDALLEEKRFERAYKVLLQREKSLLNQFRRLGVIAQPLNDKDVFELYYITYNKERSNYQSLKGVDPNNYTTLYVKKSEGRD